MNLNPTDFLLPTPALTKETLRQTSLLYSEAFTALPVDVAMSQLEIGGDWDTEQVWQQMMLFNGPAVGGMRRTLTGFEEEMKGREQRVQVVESVSEEELEEDDLEDSEQEEEIDDESEQDIIDEEMKESIASEENEEEDPEQDSDGDSELRAMMSDNEDADGSSPAATSSKSNRKSIVDDEFFSLQDMQDFSEKAEAWDEIQQGRNEEEDDDEDEAVNEFDLGLGMGFLI
jgi:U3 small nucleolar RNA-associated protein MPP10